MTTKNDIVRLVTSKYIETGKNLSVKEIAVGLECSEASIRQILTDCGGCPSGLGAEQESRPKYEKNYGTECGSFRIWVYGPTRETLRQHILLANRHLDAAISIVTRRQDRLICQGR